MEILIGILGGLSVLAMVLMIAVPLVALVAIVVIVVAGFFKAAKTQFGVVKTPTGGKVAISQGGRLVKVVSDKGNLFGGYSGFEPLSCQVDPPPAWISYNDEYPYAIDFRERRFMWTSENVPCEGAPRGVHIKLIGRWEPNQFREAFEVVELMLYKSKDFWDLFLMELAALVKVKAAGLSLEKALMLDGDVRQDLQTQLLGKNSNMLTIMNLLTLSIEDVNADDPRMIDALQLEAIAALERGALADQTAIIEEKEAALLRPWVLTFLGADPTVLAKMAASKSGNLQISDSSTNVELALNGALSEEKMKEMFETFLTDPMLVAEGVRAYSKYKGGKK